MNKTLVIAEKPSVGNSIAKVLGCKKRQDGYIEGNGYLISWCVGHLISLAEPEHYGEEYKVWDIKTLPIIPKHMNLRILPNTKKQFKILKELLDRSDVSEIICATDAGREGELIFRYLYLAAGCKKPFKRLWISSMTDTAIRKGFENLKPSKNYDNLYQSAQCRSEADWLVGMNASRAFTVKCDSLVSIGRVQTPTLAMIVNRQKEIETFKPKDYWVIKTLFKENFSGIWVSDEKDGDSKIFDKEKAAFIERKVINHLGTVKSIKKELKKNNPPFLYDLTELQRDANKKFGFSADKTLKIAQGLYEKHKMITYPRTDSRFLTSDMVGILGKTLQQIHIDPYKNLISYLLGLPKLPITKHIVNDAKVNDHHAIIPTDKIPDIGALSKDEEKVYDMVVRRFICVFYPPYQYESTVILTEVQEELFKSIGKVETELGWKVVYGKTEDNEKDVNKEDDEQDLPDIKKGQSVFVSDIENQAKKTKPPSIYTEASLLSAMENAGKFVEDEELKEQLKEGGIGTPATRAAIIERLIKVGYIKRQGKKLIPTEKGIKVIEVAPEELTSPELTGKWESYLEKIAKGQFSAKSYMESIKKFTVFIVDEAKKLSSEKCKIDDGKDKERDILGKCPNNECDGEITVNSKGYACSKRCGVFIGKNHPLLKKYKKTVTKTMVKNILKNGSLMITLDKSMAKVTIKKQDKWWNLSFEFNKK